MFKRLRSLFRVVTRRRDFEDGMSEELRFHIEQYTDDLVRSGMSREKAASQIRMELEKVLKCGRTALSRQRPTNRYLFMEAVATNVRFLTSITLPSTESNSRKKKETQPTHARSNHIDSVRDS